MNTEQKNFPNLPITHWWKIREKFKLSIPKSISPGYLSTFLGMKEDSAKVNLIPSLVKLGIIDNDGNPTERARKWREDSQYKEVCNEILEEIYPSELIEATNADFSNLDAVKTWFSTNTGLGTVAVNKMLAVYELLFRGNLDDRQQKKLTPTAKKPSLQKPKISEKNPPSTENVPLKIKEFSPNLHIDMQIHISPETTAEQIDKVFEAMAKHIFNK